MLGSQVHVLSVSLLNETNKQCPLRCLLRPEATLFSTHQAHNVMPQNRFVTACYGKLRFQGAQPTVEKWPSLCPQKTIRCTVRKAPSSQWRLGTAVQEDHFFPVCSAGSTREIYFSAKFIVGGVPPPSVSLTIILFACFGSWNNCRKTMWAGKLGQVSDRN